MRVLMTADTVGGVWTYAMQLARAAAAHGCEFLLATMGREPDDAQLAEARALPNVELAVSGYRLEWMEDPWPDVDAAGRWLLRLAERTRPDVVHLNGYAHGELPFAAPKLVVAHSCVLSWWWAVKRETAPARWTEYHARVRRGLRAADAVAAPTRVMLDEILRWYGPVPDGRVIPNGREWPASRGLLSAKQPLVAASGRLWDEAKNIRLLDAVAPELPWRCVIAGDDAPPGAVSETASRAGATGAERAGRLTPTGMTDLLTAAAIFAHPARYEPFGLAPLEAAFAGCALVLGNISSLHEVWGDAALYVNPDDPAALLLALTRLIECPAFLESRAIAARRRALRYTPAAFGEAYAHLYQSLAHRSASPVPEPSANTPPPSRPAPAASATGAA